MKTTEEFLKEEIYLPEYMLLTKRDHQNDTGIFSFRVNEPHVTRGSLSTYLTPRGLHICISQATYALFEEKVRAGGVQANVSIPDLREYALEGRLKITELNQKFRREISLLEEIEGRVNITRLRWGQLPIVKFDFDFEDGAIHGDLVSVIAPEPVGQSNRYALRN